MRENLVRKFGGPVPRYTSYPTAPHFHEGVTAETYADWLGGLNPGDGPVSLYLHIPFCQELCTYCGCNTKITRKYAPVDAYAETLGREIDQVADRIPGRLAVSHVHFGGGTPNILKAEDFVGLVARLARNFEFGDDTDIAVELDPRVLTPEMAYAMASVGVSRASLGVQDLNPDVQEAINRVQPRELVRDAVDLLRAAGITSINLDLMYGLPLQTGEMLLRTVDQAAAMAPDRIALFGYAHVPWMKANQRLLEHLPRMGLDGRFVQAEAAANRLEHHGYRRIGLDHFARPDDALARARDEGRLRRNFQGYTTDQADVLLAFGASAIGHLPQGYVQNAPDARGYRRSIEGGGLATIKGRALIDDDRIRRRVIECLMCDFDVDLSPFGGADAFAPELARLHAMAADGIVRVDGARVTVPEDARALVRSVAAVFDAYLAPPEAAASPARHSLAV